MKSSHAVVIGAGFGGIAAALRLRARGYAVTVVEATEQAGGRAAVFEKDGFKFDAGPTVVTAPYLFDELFELFGKDREDYVKFVPVDPFYRVNFHTGETFDYVGDEERLLAQIADFNPRDVDGYKKLAAHARRIFDKGYTELADVPFSHVGDMLKVVPDMMKLQNYRSVYGLVSKYIKDERLRQVLTFEPLLIGGNPFRASSIYLLIHWLERKWGVHYAMGGTGAIVSALVQLAEEEGVEFHFNAPVEEIVVENGKTTGVKARGLGTIACDLVTSNADPSFVYKNLIDEQHRKKHTNKRVDKVKQSMSLFVLYFGADKTYDDLAHHTIVLGPRYKGLLDDIFEKRHLADDFSLYLHAPARSDPAMAPAGKEAFYVLSPVPNLKGGQKWEDIATQYEDAILGELERRCLPGLGEHLETRFSVDPRYFKETLNSVDGAAFGPEPILTQSAWFRYHNQSPDVDKLYFVGAGTHPGAGMPGVLCTAKVLEHVVQDPANPQPRSVPKKTLTAA